MNVIKYSAQIEMKLSSVMLLDLVTTSERNWTICSKFKPITSILYVDTCSVTC